MKYSKRIFSLFVAFFFGIQTIASSTVIAYAKDSKDLESENRTIINVVDYGADPSGKEDSAIAIQKAIEAAKEVKGPVTISFPKGEYDIYPDYAVEKELYITNTVGADQNYKMKKIGILLEDMNDVIVEGNDSLFMFHGKMMTFAAINSSNVSFQNFSIDFQTPTVIDITVEDTDNNSATVYIPECYNYKIEDKSIRWESDKSPCTGEVYWTTTNSMNYTQLNDVKTGLTWRGGNPLFSNISSIEDLGNNRVKFNYTSKHSSIEKGISYQMRPTVRDHAGAFIWQSKDVQLKNLDFYFLHGFGIVGQFSENITLDTINFEAPAESGRTTSGYADFIQMSGCKGEINILNSSFSNPHDDPINIHGTFLQVVERISDREFKVQYRHNETAGFPNFYVGDEVEFMTKGNMIPVEGSRAKVAAVQGPTGDSNDGNLTDITITLDKDMPKDIVANGYVVENITYTPSVNIKNNVFKETPTRGILVTTRKKVVIEDNIFDGMGMAAIYISNDAQGWYESGPTRDVLIRKNIFKRSGIGTAKQPVIYIDPTNPIVSTSDTVHDNIKIIDNTFYMSDNNVLGAKSVSNLTFKNNEIYRYDPNVEINLTSDKSELKVGEGTVLNANTSANELKSKLYDFNGCKNVILEDNKYDGGLNMTGNFRNMTFGDIIQNDGISFNGGNDISNPVGHLFYESSDENVITVSSDGVVKAVGEGTATVSAYNALNNRKYESNKITYNVVGNGEEVWAENVKINGGIDKITEIGTVVKFTAEVLPKESTDKSLTWKVLDPITGKESEKATINDGELIAKENGILEVVAITSNGIEDRKILVIQTVGDKQLSDNFNVEHEKAGKWSIVNENALKLQAQSGSLWATGTTNNIIVGDINRDLNNVTVTLKVDGFTKSSYDEAGLIFYKDENNYVSVERKHANGNPKIHVVTESNGSPNENDPISDSKQEAIYYKLIKNENRITGYYSEDEINWIEIRSIENNSLGNNFKIGIIASGGTETNTPFIFSELKVDGEEVSFVTENEAPIVSNITTSYDSESKKLNVSYDFTDNNSEGNTVVKWATSDKLDGEYKIVIGLEGNNISVNSLLEDKYVKAIVIPKDSNGMIGDKVWSSNGVLVNESSSEDPPNLKSSNELLKYAEFSGVDSGEFEKKNKYYMATAEANQNKLGFNLTADNEDATIKVIANGKEVVTANEGHATGDILLSSGINVIEVNVTAADGKNIKEYRFVVLKKGYNNSKLRDLKVGNMSLEGFDAEKNEYTYVIKDNNVKSININAIAESPSSTLVIRDNNYNIYTESSVNVDLVEGVNKIVVAVNPDTSAPKNYYSINIKVPKKDNANLEKMNFEGNVILDKVFSPKDTDYKGTISNQRTKINLVAEEPGAAIKLDVNGKVFESKKSTLEKNISLYKGYNLIKVTVIAPDKTEKEYKVELEGKDIVYLSDIDYTNGSFTGWGKIQKDREAGGVEGISLIDEEGNKVNFEKGIGTHANSEIIYDIEGKGFKEFKTYLGVDASQKDKGSVTFKIYADDKEVYSSEEMTGLTPMKFVSIDVKGVNKLKLVCERGQNDWNDHADFADAKFTTSFLDKEDIDIRDSLEEAILRGEIKESEGFNEFTTTKSTWKLYVDALDVVKKLLEEEKPNKDKAKNSIESLNAAIDGLTLRADEKDLETLMSLINENKEIESNYSAEIYSAMKKAIKIGEDILSKDANEISASEVKEALTELSNKKEVLNLYLKEKVDELKTKIDEANNRLSGDLSNSELVNQLKLAVEEGNILINENSKNTLNIISATNKIEEALRNLEASLPDDGDDNETDDNGTNPGNEENNQESGKNSLGNINDKNEASIPETGGNNPVNRILFGVILLSVGASLIFNKKSKLVK